MTQVEFECFAEVVGIAMQVFNVVMLIYLWDAFYKLKKRTAVFACIIVTAFLLVMKQAGAFSGGGRLLILSVLAVVYGFIRHRPNWQKSVLAASCFYGFRSLDWLISISVQQNALDAAYSSIEDEIGSGRYLADLYRLSSMVNVGFVLVYALLFWVMIFVFRRIMRDVDGLCWPDTAFLSVLNVVGSLFAEMVTRICILPLEKEVFVLFNEANPASFLVPCIALLLYLGEVAAACVYVKYKELIRERERHIAEGQQLQAMKVRLSEAEEFYGSIRKVRHEMRNHLANIRALAAGDEASEAERYIEKLEGSVEKLDLKYDTGNAVTDVIVNDRAKRAEQGDIKFDIEWLCNDYGNIDVFDIGMILSNILDNALEACERVSGDRRFIRLSLKRKKNFLIITSENSCEKEPVFGPDGLPATTKADAERPFSAEHGIGLCNVKEIAGRYFGTMDIQAKDKVFTITIMLQR